MSTEKKKRVRKKPSGVKPANGTGQPLTGQAWEKGKSVKCSPDTSEKSTSE